MLHIASFEQACAILDERLRPKRRGWEDGGGIIGEGWVELRNEHGELKQLCAFRNLITDVGDAYYAKRAANISTTPNQVSGMRLGTDNTTPTKNGSASAIIAYANTGDGLSSKGIDTSAGFPQGSQSAGAGYQVQWRTSWAAGEATANNLQEVVITNESTLTNVAGTAANTIARAILNPPVNKAALDTLVVTWNHLLKGT